MKEGDQITEIVAALRKQRPACLAVGASFGGIEALQRSLGGLGVNTWFPVLLALHLSPDSPGVLPEVLAPHLALPVHEAVAGEPLSPAVVYTAPPDYHLAVEGGDQTISLSTEERINYARPSIDVLFTSVAHAFQEKAFGILLTGANEDGAEGLRQIHLSGGITLVQDPDEAAASAMPAAAISLFRPRHVARLDELRDILRQLTKGPHTPS
jgi:two-component system, chemotaxis family, protein-glutamate methylesterase/glutaminase